MWITRNSSYRVCSPCFQIGFEKFKMALSRLFEKRKWFAMDFDLGKIEDKEYEEKARLYLLNIIVNDYKVNYDRIGIYTN